MRTLNCHWTIDCDTCDYTSKVVADNYEDPIVLPGWVRDGDRDTCHECQLKADLIRHAQ